MAKWLIGLLVIVALVGGVFAAKVFADKVAGRCCGQCPPSPTCPCNK